VDASPQLPRLLLLLPGQGCQPVLLRPLLRSLAAGLGLLLQQQPAAGAGVGAEQRRPLRPARPQQGWLKSLRLLGLWRQRLQPLTQLLLRREAGQ